MKITISLFVLFCLFTGREMLAQEVDITGDGTWKLDGDKLTCGFVMEGNPMDIVWGFYFTDDTIHLKRTAPDGSAFVVNSFKRK